jgi:hypothetical protein
VLPVCVIISCVAAHVGQTDSHAASAALVIVPAVALEMLSRCGRSMMAGVEVGFKLFFCA